jgi:protein MpaA
MSTLLTPPPKPASTDLRPARRAVDRLLAPLDELALRSPHFLRRPLGNRPGSDDGVMPRYFLLGPRGGGDYLRLGLFATIHGDEPEGALAIVRFLAHLERNPDLARGYALYFYPLCNPTGFEDRTRTSRSGKDLNREFWKGSAEPEVRWLETEIWTHAFHGIVNLHTDDTSDGLYGYANGAIHSENLLEPALRAGEKFLPRNRRRRIDGFPARRGIIYDSYEGVLRAVPGLPQPPFEVTLETPQKAPLHLQVEAFNAGLETILQEFRYLMAIGADI